MTIDATIPGLFAIAMPCIALAYTLAIGARRSTPADAMRTAWQAWQYISERALEKGQPVPPPPHEGKR